VHRNRADGYQHNDGRDRGERLGPTARTGDSKREDHYQRQQSQK
jgi:hypothetical protein